MPDIYQIGSQYVGVSGTLPVCLQALRRVPVQSSRFDVELIMRPASVRDWQAEIKANSDIYEKGMPGHFLHLDFNNRRLRIRYLCPMQAEMRYFVLRDLFCALGALSGEPLLHASAVILNRKAVAFCGESGAGKSTIAAMFQQVGVVVNDEINWVISPGFALVNQRYWAGPGALTAKTLLPLRKIYLLRQSAGCKIETVAAAAAFPLLLAAPYGGKDPTLARRSRTTSMLSSTVPLSVLYFNQNPDEVRDLVLQDI